MEKVIIAGGTSGMGLSTAKLLSSKGYQVTVLGRSPEKLKKALDEIGPAAAGKSVDARDTDGLREVFKTAGEFDHLVICISGGKGIGAFRDLDLGVLREGFDEKFFPQLQTAQAALPYLPSTGSITFITAVSAQSKLQGTSGLGAVNGALEIMVPTLAKELKPLRVNAVSPGVIDTAWWDFLATDQKKETFETYAKSIPAGRIGAPEEVAAMIVALIENAYVTGQVIAVDGGISLGQ
jgi:NAD(P)-dependent dehydrogenase (short-subunit alcohol dehydrogenase family)